MLGYDECLGLGLSLKEVWLFEFSFVQDEDGHEVEDRGVQLVLKSIDVGQEEFEGMHVSLFFGNMFILKEPCSIVRV